MKRKVQAKRKEKKFQRLLKPKKKKKADAKQKEEQLVCFVEKKEQVVCSTRMMNDMVLNLYPNLHCYMIARERRLCHATDLSHEL